MDALHGVGDEALGQWEGRGDVAYHIRRRLSTEEQELVGDVLDVRGTPEALRRYNLIRRYLPQGWKEIE